MRKRQGGEFGLETKGAVASEVVDAALEDEKIFDAEENFGGDDEETVYVEVGVLAKELGCSTRWLERAALELCDGDGERWICSNGDARMLLHSDLVELIRAREEVEQAYTDSDDREPKDRQESGPLQVDSVEQLFFDEIGKHDLLTPEEERWLLEHKEDRTAHRELMEANLRLVVSIARRYRGRGLPFMDLIQEGNLGLDKAIDKFDVSKQCRLSTYASWWIRQYMGRALVEQVPLVRVAECAVDIYRNGQKYIRQIYQEEGRVPSAGEIACRLGISQEKWSEVVRAMQRPFEIDNPVASSSESMDTPATAGHLASSETDNPANETMRVMIWQRLDEIMPKVLSEPECRAMRLYYSLDGAEETRTLREVGEIMGISGGGAGQLIRRGCKKLYRVSEIRQLLEGLWMMEQEGGCGVEIDQKAGRIRIWEV